MPHKNRRIAIFLPLESDHSARLLQGALRYSREQPQVTLVDLFYPVDAPDRLRLREPLDFDAAVIWASQAAPWVEALLERKVPLVSVSGDWPVERVPCVSFDSEAVVQAAVDHLAAARPAKLWYFDFRLKGLPVKERRVRLFREMAQQHGIRSSSRQVFELGEDDASEIARRLPLEGEPARRLRQALATSPLPAGIWCGEDHLARRVCDIARDLELRVPEDVAVLGLGDFPLAECGSPTLSSLPLPGERIGYQAVSLLHQLLATGQPLKPFTPVQPPPVTGRESTAGHGPDDAAGLAFTVIARRACEGITVKEIAAELRLSPQALHARFGQRYGHSPGEQIRRTRLATAKRHLADPSLTISQVAAKCGFDQANRFSNFFRRETGASPREWRKEHHASPRTRLKQP